MLTDFRLFGSLLLNPQQLGLKSISKSLTTSGKLQHPGMSSITALLTVSLLSSSLLLILENVVEKFVFHDIRTL